MATYRVKSGASGAANGSTWADAYTTLAAAAAVDAAGDLILVSSSHAESSASGQSVTLAGTAANPVRVVCAPDASEDPTTSTTGASVTTTGTSAISFSGSAYLKGIDFHCGTGASSAAINMALTAGTSEIQDFEECNFRLNTAAASTLNIGSTTSTVGKTVRWRNCGLRFANSGQRIAVYGIDSFIWEGGSMLSGSSTNTGGLVAVSNNGRGGNVEFSGLDLTALSTSMVLFVPSSTFVGKMTARNISLPSGIAETGWLVGSGQTTYGWRAEAYDCAAGDSQLRVYAQDYSGYMRDEAVIVRTGGAAIDSVPLSWKLVSTANASAVAAFRTVEHHIPNSAVGSPITIEAEIVTDGVTLTDADIRLDVFSKSTSGSAVAALASSRTSDVLGTPSNLTTSTEAWTTTGLSSPTKQRISITVTPQEVGSLICRLVLSKASTTVYCDLPRKA